MSKIDSLPILYLLDEPDGPARIDRFWALVDKQGPDDCWDWQGSINTSGYGRFKAASYVTIGAHRFSLVLDTRTDHTDLLAIHGCDRPPCCNPGHLRWGTVQDNSDDMVMRGRHRSPDQEGFSNGACKLSRDQFEQVIIGFQLGLNNKQIAEGLPVDHAMISRIRRGRSWVKQATSLGWTPQPKYASLKGPRP